MDRNYTTVVVCNKINIYILDIILFYTQNFTVMKTGKNISFGLSIMLLVCPKNNSFFSTKFTKKISYFTSVWPDDIILVGSVRYISFLSYFLFAWAHIPPPFSQKGYRDWKGFQGYEDTIVCTYHCWGPFYGGEKGPLLTSK